MIELHLGDCLDVLAAMEPDSVDTCITDPPAGISFMGREWDSDKGGRDHWIAWLTKVLKEVHRVMKPGGSLVIWSIPRTSHWTGTAVENAGFRIIDVITHLFGSGFPKSHSLGKATGLSEWSGHGTALKPAAEFWWLAYKPRDGTFANNALVHGVAGLWIDGARVPTNGRQEWEQGQHLCDSCAGDAAKKQKPTTRAIKANFAAKNAAQITNEKAKKNHTDSNSRDIGCSDGPCQEEQGASPSGNSNLSTDMSGNATMGQFPRVMSSIISTETKPTTELRTCALCGAALMSHTTTKQETTHTQGRWPSNLILSHTDQCVRVGTKRVRGSYLDHHCSQSVNKTFGQAVDHHGTGYTDPDGYEQVEHWECSPECPVRLLDEQSGELTSGGGNKSRRGWSRDNERAANCYGTYAAPPPDVRDVDTGGASRFFMRFAYVPKASRAERNAGLEGMEERSSREWRTGNAPPNISHRVPDKRAQNHHPTVKPVALLEYLCRLTKTPTGGVVLDPFMGSGSTGLACVNEGRDFIGIELDPEYMEIARRRIEYAQQNREPEQLGLFEGHQEAPCRH